ncbi:hypothetical protein BJ684DRAFT_18390 [Piptocephalis cylindrospora]|uniref:Uncharacterized protein n=1 Tax=Piptocephalis cylindrospora TaxID=1907219 RepID=A0A4P9Y9Y7_9FUNG|nr:hypothetical protein BJ684DRAFT_18390 [Piptocephalis cylindrospora]|eukprot:RKP15271.1 hypothetical protein BJ684DRAFT_18390 [Piptocephalis cylindrospora]
MSSTATSTQPSTERDRARQRREARQRRILASGSDRLSRIKQAVHSDAAVLDPQGSASLRSSRASSPVPSARTSRRPSVTSLNEKASVPLPDTPAPSSASSSRRPSVNIPRSSSSSSLVSPVPMAPPATSMDDLDHLLRELSQPEGPIVSHRHISSDSMSSPAFNSSLSPSSSAHLPSSQSDALPTPDQVLPPGLLALWNASALPSSPSSFLGPEGRKQRRSSLHWSLIHALLLFTLLVYWVLPRSSPPDSSKSSSESNPTPYTPVFWYFVLLQIGLQSLRYHLSHQSSSAPTSASSSTHAAEDLIAWGKQQTWVIHSLFTDIALLIFLVGLYSALLLP